MREEITVLTSEHITLGTTILLAIPFTYVKGSFEHVILLASEGPIETKKLLNSLAMTSLSVTIVLFMLNVNFLLESFPIIKRSIFQDLDKSIL